MDKGPGKLSITTIAPPVPSPPGHMTRWSTRTIAGWKGSGVRSKEGMGRGNSGMMNSGRVGGGKSNVSPLVPRRGCLPEFVISGGRSKALHHLGCTITGEWRREDPRAPHPAPHRDSNLEHMSSGEQSSEALQDLHQAPRLNTGGQKAPCPLDPETVGGQERHRKCGNMAPHLNPSCIPAPQACGNPLSHHPPDPWGDIGTTQTSRRASHQTPTGICHPQYRPSRTSTSQQE